MLGGTVRLKDKRDVGKAFKESMASARQKYPIGNIKRYLASCTTLRGHATEIFGVKIIRTAWANLALNLMQN